MQTVNNGDTVRVHYTGRLKDGTVFDSSSDREPLEFKAGGTDIIPGFSNAVIGMKTGEEKTVDIPPEQAYGEHSQERIHKVETGMLPPNTEVGSALRAQDPNTGQHMDLWVIEMNDEFAMLDANHPLAGKDLVFDIQLVAINP